MNQKENEKLADQFIRAVLNVQAGEKVWVEYIGSYAKDIADACSDKVSALGGIAHVVDRGSDRLNKDIPVMDVDDMKAQGAQELATMKEMDCYIRIDDNAEEGRINVSTAQLGAYKKYVMGDMTGERVRNTRWLVTSAPTPEFAQACNMTSDEANEYYTQICSVDYGFMADAVKPLVKRMAEGSEVHIIGQGTDLRFSIAGINAIPCTGTHNIPDGECFTAPVRDSVNGTIRFGQSSYMGERFEFIELSFENGKAVKAVAEDEERTKALNAILDTDDGARYIGEFAIAFNPYVLEPIGDILFDEKIAGSLHCALGEAYDVADNGNVSNIHWDMVHIQRPEHGGGQIWIDGELIRDNGLFVPEDLQILNPDSLIAIERERAQENAGKAKNKPGL